MWACMDRHNDTVASLDKDAGLGASVASPEILHIQGNEQSEKCMLTRGGKSMIMRMCSVGLSFGGIVHSPLVWCEEMIQRDAFDGGLFSEVY